MRTALLLAFVFALSTTVLAGPILISDPFPGSSGPTPAFDVIGARADFDIQSLAGIITPDLTTLQLAFNYRYPDLAQYTDFGLELNVGDLLVKVGDDYRYGIALLEHGPSPNGGPFSRTVLAGHLYQINNPSGTLNARLAMGNPQGLAYRPDEEVWLRENGLGLGSLTDLVTGTVTLPVPPYGDGVTSAKYLVTLQFATPPQFWQDFNGPGLTFHFASTTSANDILEGTAVNGGEWPGEAPEAGTSLLIGGGLLLLGLLVRAKRQQAPTA